MLKPEIELVRQPSPNTCVHACLAMVTGLPVAQIVDELPAPAGPEHYNAWLVRHSIRAGDPTELMLRGELYLLSVASRNLLGKLHMIVADLRHDYGSTGLRIWDPVDGVEGKTAWTTEDWEAGLVSWAHGIRLVDCSR